MTENLLEINDLEVVYKSDRSVVRAVNRIGFSLKAGETIGIAGETGAGKTTTALAILGLLPKRTGRVTGGAILYEGEDLLKKNEAAMRLVRGACISMIFQDPMTSLNPVRTVGDQIMESLKIHSDIKNTAALDARVDELLTMVSIKPSRKHEYPHQFSGGMKQRVVIAISLACNPRLIIADEPTTALDVTIQSQVLGMINELKKRLGTSMIMITHDLGVVAQTCDKVAIMYAGEIVEQGSVEDVFSVNKHHPYTEGLFGAIPDLEKESARLIPIDGLMPDPIDLPPGCKFHPRCKYCMDRCKTDMPGIRREGEHAILCHLFTQERSHG
jgi:peptide/nickel transport system ATP-binding protein